MYWEIHEFRPIPRSKSGVTTHTMDKKFGTKKEAVDYAQAHGITRYRVEKAKDSGEGSDFDVKTMVTHLNHRQNLPRPPERDKEESMKKGGMVKSTKSHLLHKGELVVPATVVKHLEKLLKKK